MSIETAKRLAETLLRVDAASKRSRDGNRVFVDVRDWEIALAEARAAIAKAGA